LLAVKVSIKFESQVFPDVQLPADTISDFRAGLRLRLKITQEFGVKVFDDKLMEWVPLVSLERLPSKKILVELLRLSLWNWDVTSAPWQPVTDGIYSLEVKEGAAIRDEAAYKRFLTLAPFFGVDPDKVTKVTAISNEALLGAFAPHKDICAARHLKDPGLFKSSDWEMEKKPELRKEYLQRSERYVSQFEWNKEGEVSVIPLIQGTGAEIARKISEVGFASLSSRDAGFYGKGVYFTSKFEYAEKYAANYKDPAFIIAMVTIGNVFPVVESPHLPHTTVSNPYGYLGKPLRVEYQSHFSLVDATKPDAYPVGKTAELDAATDEYVVFQEAQALPLFYFQVGK